MKATVYIGTSLDGFIAREDGGIDWLVDPPDSPQDPEEDFGFAEFFETVDALVMGRNTFDLVRTFDVWAYGDKPVIVLSSREVEIPEERKNTVEWMNASPSEVVRRLEKRGIRHIYVDGGDTIQRFLAEGLIQRMIITRLPILIGRGIPLFGPVPHDIRLRHVETKVFPNGFVKSEYEVLGNGSAVSDGA
jgi:dihydrofolate reductase